MNNFVVNIFTFIFIIDGGLLMNFCVMENEMMCKKRSLLVCYGHGDVKIAILNGVC